MQMHYYLRRQLAVLRTGRVPLEQLVVRQTLSRDLGLFTAPSPAAVKRSMESSKTNPNRGQLS